MTTDRIRADRERGFTVLELLVVIAVIGLLTAIAIPLFTTQRKKAQVSTLRHDLRNVARGVETWYALGNTNANFVPLDASGYVYKNANGVSTIFPYTTEQKQTAMEAVPITMGTGIFILPNAGGYCIVGARRGTDFNYGVDGGPSGGSELHRFLYYDSLAGGIKERAQIAPSGANSACWPYR